METNSDFDAHVAYITKFNDTFASQRHASSRDSPKLARNMQLTLIGKMIFTLSPPHLPENAAQGTRGEAGQRYHERMGTSIATCKKQDRNFFTFLLDSVTAQLDQTPAPALLNA